MESADSPAWILTRLQQLIADKIEEGPQLDYKEARFLGRAENQKDAITKTVSAFANSSGGTVIFGISEFEEKEKKHLPEKIDPVDGLEFSREWLDQILGQISPRIEGLKITPVRVGPEDRHVCYVVDIPESQTAHQARDCKYYRRYNFEAVPMSDREIRDVMGRRKHPKLEFQARVVRTAHSTTMILARIWNKGLILAHHYEVKVLMPINSEDVCLSTERQLVHEANGLPFLILTLINRSDRPLFPKSDTFCELVIGHVFNPLPTPPAEHMLCSLFADEMPVIERKISVREALAGWV